jgi:hypothetical protein
MTGKQVTNDLDDVRADRQSDLTLLDDLLNNEGELSQEEYDAFDDMRDRLRRQQAHFRLSEKQRKWAEAVADRIGIAYVRRSAEKAENIARGREVVLGGVLSQDSIRAALLARRR